MADKDVLNKAKELAPDDLEQVNGGLLDRLTQIEQVTPNQFSDMLPNEKNLNGRDGKRDYPNKTVHPG